MARLDKGRATADLSFQKVENSSLAAGLGLAVRCWWGSFATVLINCDVFTVLDMLTDLIFCDPQ